MSPTIPDTPMLNSINSGCFDPQYCFYCVVDDCICHYNHSTIDGTISLT